jgi:hypothetical protein
MKNGQQLKKVYAEEANAWVLERNKKLDWKEYEFNHRINRRKLVKEVDFSYSVCTQNKDVRKILESAEQLWFGSEKSCIPNLIREAKPLELSTDLTSSSNNKLTKRITKLEIENRELNQQLKTYKVQQALIENGATGFKI